VQKAKIYVEYRNTHALSVRDMTLKTKLKNTM